MTISSKWYIIQTLSGSENLVKKAILEQAMKKNMSEFFEEIRIPLIEVSGVKRGEIVKIKKKFMPGYVLIKMNMTDESWHLVKSVAKIAKFLGSKTRPESLSDKEVQNIFDKLESESQNVAFAELFKIGEQVIVIEGPFDNFVGIVEEINMEKQKLRVAILIFGKATPMDLSFTQVKKV